MFKYEIYDESGETIALGTCDNATADTARGLCYSEIDNLQTVYDCQRDRMAPGCYSYEIIAIINNNGQNNMETFTVTIK
jgi:hypothetical protein